MRILQTHWAARVDSVSRRPPLLGGEGHREQEDRGLGCRAPKGTTSRVYTHHNTHVLKHDTPAEYPYTPTLTPAVHPPIHSYTHSYTHSHTLPYTLHLHLHLHPLLPSKTHTYTRAISETWVLPIPVPAQIHTYGYYLYPYPSEKLRGATSLVRDQERVE